MHTNERRFSVLLCYDAVDAHPVRRFAAQLRNKSIDAKLASHDLPAGEDLGFAIERQIRESQLVLVFLSRNSVSNAGVLQKQIVTALDVAKEKPPSQVFVIPVRLDDCSTHLRLARLQRCDVLDPQGWATLLDRVVELHNRFRLGITQRESPSKVIDRIVGGARSDPTGELPFMTFPREIKEFVCHCMPLDEWRQLSKQTRHFILTLGCKLEPIVQIVPACGTMLVIGFECLALGAMGEGFDQICKRAKSLDPGLLRLCLAVAAVKSIAAMRSNALKDGKKGVKNLIFSINLDPLMVDSPHFPTFLEWHPFELNHNVIFEINETTTARSLPKFKELQVDFDLRYSADDLNSWDPEVRDALIDRVEMTKLDYKTFSEAMEGRKDDPYETLFRLKQHKVRDKPLIVEGVRPSDFEFLERWWKFPEMGYLYGQGQSIDCGPPWMDAVFPLKPYGGLGGGFLRRPESGHDDDAEEDFRGESGGDEGDVDSGID